MERRRRAGWVAGLAALLVTGGLCFTTAGAADSAGKWLHVRVVGGGGKQESVKVNLPLAVLETMAESIEDEHFTDGRMQLGDAGLTSEQLRTVWQSLKTSRDMEFVTVESRDETVRVAKAGRHLVFKVNGDRSDDDGPGTVDIKLPIEVVDALLQAPEGHLNVKAAIQALAQYGGGDLIQLKDRSSSVRIWIDDRSDSEI